MNELYRVFAGGVVTCYVGVGDSDYRRKMKKDRLVNGPKVRKDLKNKAIEIVNEGDGKVNRLCGRENERV